MPGNRGGCGFWPTPGWSSGSEFDHRREETADEDQRHKGKSRTPRRWERLVKERVGGGTPRPGENASFAKDRGSEKRRGTRGEGGGGAELQFPMAEKRRPPHLPHDEIVIEELVQILILTLKNTCQLSHRDREFPILSSKKNPNALSNPVGSPPQSTSATAACCHSHRPPPDWPCPLHHVSSDVNLMPRNAHVRRLLSQGKVPLIGGQKLVSVFIFEEPLDV
ncbi:hypothetical protein PR202_gb13370 [Eleusine coracana subsp. coracana]|uniref:Uncharacterized protein n=1 Tax=Eleusine coracana subsp. coracana TaxID=191504 RepID=A0AAV5EQ33_ELECO|nr:hypothetical protein PR202_gb13370 [Eleusine coracana subsp. coracana]